MIGDIGFGWLSVISALCFCTLLVVAAHSMRLYFFLLPVVILCVPNAINDIFPGQSMAPNSALWYPPDFSLITHIDIFLLFGVFYYWRDLGVRLLDVLVLMFAVVVVFLLYLFGVWKVEAIYGLYQIRYAFLIYLIFRRGLDEFLLKNIFKGYSFAFLFVCFESVVFTLLVGDGGLVSGNLGKNPLGHMLAASVIMFFSMPNDVVGRFKKYAFSALAFVFLIWNGTRFSLMALLVVSLGWLLFRKKKPVWNWLIFLMLPLLLIVFVSIPQVGSIISGLQAIDFDPAVISDSDRTEDSSSMVTRMVLWYASFEIFMDNYWLGVGPGGWSFLKDGYIGADRYLFLLDPHSDVFNYFVSYGFFLGFAFYLFVFSGGLKYIFLRRDSRAGLLEPAALFVLVIFFTGLTNATTWKHQVFSMSFILSMAVFFIGQRRVHDVSNDASVI